MKERIAKLLDMCLKGELYKGPTHVEYERTDLLLDPVEMSAKRLREYLLAQDPMLTKYSTLPGNLWADGSVEWDWVNRPGHKNNGAIMDAFYRKVGPDCILFPDWQHSVPDYGRFLKQGISGVLETIHTAMKTHTAPDQQIFLKAEETTVNAILELASKWSAYAAALAETVEEPEYKQNLARLAEALQWVPNYPARSFYEAVVCLNFIYFANPDALGPLDRYLYPYYQKDLADGTLTREEAISLLQEMFLQIQSYLKPENQNFTRGGECHVGLGGYTADGEDGFNELSQLIVTAVLELPIYKPNITMRWTKKTPREVLRFMLDCERHDPHKRIAFTNDEQKIKGLVENAGVPYEIAVNYSPTGCNELVLSGGNNCGGGNGDMTVAIQPLFHGDRKAEVLACKTFDEVYAIFEEELFKHLGKVLEMHEIFNKARWREVNLLSSFLYNGCIENGRSISQGGIELGSHSLSLMGEITLVDSLTVIKQFVFDEQLVTMEELQKALEDNWEGHEDLHTLILKKARYFGNNDELSDGMIRRLRDSIYGYLKDKEDPMGRKYMLENLTGYQEYQKWFGSLNKATPDGRYDGEPVSFGCGQTNGRDREGLSALLTSIAQSDPHALTCSGSVTNITLDPQLVYNDENFEKLVVMFETYFRQGGQHFQTTYVSKEDLINAKKLPENYKSLRVRVSGFSEYFVRLQEAMQDDIIRRTEKAG